MSFDASATCPPGSDMEGVQHQTWNMSSLQQKWGFVQQKSWFCQQKWWFNQQKWWLTNRHGAINKKGVLINKNADSLPEKDWDLPHENKDSTMKRLVSIGFKKPPFAQRWVMVPGPMDGGDFLMSKMILHSIWLVVSIPLKNISRLGLLFPIYGKHWKTTCSKPATRHYSVKNVSG